ncbi:MAG TPA: GldG family protein [Rariglobus sp.]|jgi:ABC-type uncharacterized transport system involved in gliding motility auxiliary subunit|nr:GldG family protein [Rariglobus sp.]
MKFGSKTVVIVLLFVGLVLVNYLASQLPVRIDATADQIYTLSPGTKSLLGKINEPITLNFYFSKDVPGLPVAYVNFAARVQEMLRQYVRASNGRLSLKVINPKTDTPEEEHATAAGLESQRAPGSGEAVYFGLVAIQADQQKAIPAFTPQRESFLEYDLSQLIDSVQRTDRKKLGLITSLPLQAPPYNPMMMQQAPDSGQLIAKEWARTFDLVPVQNSADALPEHLDALAIIHPQAMSQKLQYAIDQFILAGKPVFVAVDPSSQYFKARGGQAAMFGGGARDVSSELPDLFKAYGVSFDEHNVVGDPDNATQVQTGAGGIVTRLPTWISLGPDNLSAKALPTAQLQSLLFIEPGSFTITDEPGVTVTKLAETSGKSGTVMATTLQMLPPDDIAKQILPSGKRTLAAMLTGKFKTAFPDGMPKTEADKKANPFPELNKGPASLKESKTSSTVILAADTDWLLDDYSVRKVNFLGTQGAEPLNDNLAFASNAVEFLAGSPDLISIRGKGNALRPFTVVTKMENEAQQKYQEQLDALETRIADTQSKLSAIQSKQTDGGRLIATPEVQKTIREFQEQEASMREQRREIRLALRVGIDALGNRLLLLNLLATPLLVGVFGLWFYRARRR